jgi:hypothetical protein
LEEEIEVINYSSNYSYNVPQHRDSYRPELGIPLVRPFSAPITVVESDVRVISLTYTYDPVADIITTVKTTLENTALTGRNCVVHVVLFDRDGNVIAQGSSSQVTVGGGSTLQVTISLNWGPGKSVSDLASGRVAVEQK